MAAHARLSPSSFDRVIACPASVRMKEVSPPSPSSAAAMEGTYAHAMGEAKAIRAFGLKPRHLDHTTVPSLSDADRGEIEHHTDGYVRFLQERVGPQDTLMLEVRLDTGLPNCWGTADAAILRPAWNNVEVIDLKYGRGHDVPIENNPQLMLYGLGLLNMAEPLFDVDTITLAIYQPRLSGVKEIQLTREELLEWRDTVALPAAKLALTDDAPFGPSDDACRWCPAAGVCLARADQVMSAFDDLSETTIDLMSPELLAKALSCVDGIEAWCGDVRKAALHQAYEGNVEVPGYKVVWRAGRRYIADPIALAERLGLEHDKVYTMEPKPVALGKIERLAGKEELDRLAGDAIRSYAGKPAIVPKSAKGAPITRAETAFSDDI